MRLETFALERFQSIWENRVAWNVSESGVHPLRVSERIDSPALQDVLLEQELGYPQTNGTVALREVIAAIYPGATPDHVRVTNGGRGVLLVPGDDFDTDGYFRIGFGSDPEYLESASFLIGELLDSVGAHAR